MDVILHHQTLTLNLMLTLTLTILYNTLSYYTLTYYTVSYHISMIEQSSTIVVGGMMQIALRPLFHHKNAVPIFSLHKYNYYLTCTTTLSQQSTTCI